METEQDFDNSSTSTYSPRRPVSPFPVQRNPNPNAPTVSRNRVEYNEPEEKRWGYSTKLMLYDDPWKIKKVLTKSDLGSLNRLLLATDLVEDLVLPVLSEEARINAETEEGTEVTFWDVDTNSMYDLVFKRWGSSRSYVFIGKWNQEFVKRRGLKKGDEIGLHWDPYKNRFDFSLLKRASETAMKCYIGKKDT